ncbi:Yqey-like protein [compost metagenome]
MAVLMAYLPQQLSDAEIDTMIEGAILSSGAAGMQDMGKVMALLKPHMAGRADMAAVSARIKAKLAG